MMAKYDELDELILAELDNLTPVFDVWLKVKTYCERKGLDTDINLIDRRLQALKKKGMVMNVRCFGWRRTGSV